MTPQNRNRKKLYVLLAVILLGIVFVLAARLGSSDGSDPQSSSQDLNSTLQTYSNSFFEISYPKGWSKEGLATNLTFSEDTESSTEIELINVAKVGTSEAPQTIADVEKLESQDSSGEKIKNIRTEKGLKDGKNYLKSSYKKGDTKVISFYLFDPQETWRVTLNQKDSADSKISEAIISSFKLN